MFRNLFSPIKNTLIVGSAPSAVDLKGVDFSRMHGVAINNAWRVNDGFRFNVYAGDFPAEKAAPKQLNMKHISGREYMRGINASGGIIFAGATMSMAAGYWAANDLKTKIIGYYACDMIYSDKVNHFYGSGTPDPLREDISLRSLEAKATRLFCWALGKGKIIVNCSKSAQSRLTFPKSSLDRIDTLNASKKEIREIIDYAKKGWEMEARVNFDSRREDYYNIEIGDEEINFLDEIDGYWNSLSEAVGEIKLSHK